ncbi:MAG: ABC transporter substrate-binding protein [Halanaerobiales bacterium]
MKSVCRSFLAIIFMVSFFVIFILPVEASLKVGILPDADSVPLIVAEEEGLFADTGYEIEIISFHNPIERDGALQAGVIDGAISDVLAAAFFNNNNQSVKITSLTNGRYILLSGRDTGVKTYQDLKGVEIAMSSNTIIEYITDRLLKNAGFSEDEIAKIAIPKIPVRLQMLESGQVKAACLPEPLASVLLLNGANKIADSTELGEAPGIMLFTEDAVKEKEGELSAFYEAYNKAVELFNNYPDSYREILITKAGFPAELEETFVFPEYDQAKLPAVETVDLVVSWLNNKGLIGKKFTYQELVDDRFIQE